MAKKSMIVKNIRRKQIVERYRSKRMELKKIIKTPAARRLNIKIGTHFGDSCAFEDGLRGTSDVPLGVTRPPSIRFFCGLLMV